MNSLNKELASMKECLACGGRLRMVFRDKVPGLACIDCGAEFHKKQEERSINDTTAGDLVEVQE